MKYERLFFLIESLIKSYKKQDELWNKCHPVHEIFFLSCKHPCQKCVISYTVCLQSVSRIKRFYGSQGMM